MQTAEIFIPITMFIMMAAVLIVYFYFARKNKEGIQETIRRSIEHGQQLTPELLEKLSGAHSPKVKDLRRGVVLCALGIAGFFAGFVLKEPDASEVFMMLSLFPLFIGAGFLLVWKLDRYND
ncbi:DUF6249 domain-containing protein [Pleionea litopenaei]|uniref:DUF6249 domain-containing protein n=1 Tax=Pleionea litopenaei TaxID=3070815 RepID=A0AA51X7C9_9GAMM|nr:DUF6249 domain-containing protein [Pleionea sp. HL-JVS1]WMS86980.1 DUF6249 domain-containing protein [Pleionea sp. HL-JVS1]